MQNKQFTAMSENKVKQSETLEINRSEIKLANYNPRKISSEARKTLKANLKRLGLMGGIIWNKSTGNLVGGHQKVGIMDDINKYPANDYRIKVEAVELSDREEKEQNLFLNNKSAQGDFDDEMMRDLMIDIDYVNAGFSDFEASLFLPDIDVDMTVSEKTWGINDDENFSGLKAETRGKPEGGLDRSVNFKDDTEENKIKRTNDIRKIQERIRNQNSEDKDNGALSYVILSFLTPQSKDNFMIKMGYDLNESIIEGEDFSEQIERID